MMMIIVDYDGQQSGVKHELFGQGDVRQCSIASQNVQVQCECRIKLLGGGCAKRRWGPLSSVTPWSLSLPYR